MSEVEYQGIKVKGGKLFLIFPLLGTLGGAIWAGFEGYARWVAMEEKINEYVAPDLSGFTLKLDVLEERIISLEDNMGTELRSVQEVRASLRQTETDLRTMIDHASDRFDNKRTAIESDAVRRGEVIDMKLKELEDRIIKLLERALNNPLAGQ